MTVLPEPLQRFLTVLPKPLKRLRRTKAVITSLKRGINESNGLGLRYQLIETSTIPAVIRSAPIVSRALSFSFNTTAARIVIKITLKPWKG